MPVSSANFPSDLTQPLPLPANPGGPKYTRSERFFLLATNVNIHALSIGKGEEFFMFMDLRAENKWVTYNMTTAHYLHATSDFNSRLQQQSNTLTTLKTARAIMDKLAEVEDIIANRIITKNYRCASVTDLSTKTS
jgi:predicted acyltransferase (DUF342 family)